MANHKWENDMCIQCGLYRTEIETDGNGSPFQYSFDKKQWLVKRPECEKAKSYIQSQDLKTKKLWNEYQLNRKIIDDNTYNKVDYKQNYVNLLKSPKWQQKRLKIMQRDNWTCRSCGDDINELHVHHYQYTTHNPWDELDTNLVTLCNTCHKAIHYINSCPDIGIETFIPLMKLLDEEEQKDIKEYYSRKKNGQVYTPPVENNPF